MPAEKNLRGVLRDTVLCVYCDVEDMQCRKWNEDRREKGEEAYNDVIFEDLVRRFENPDRRNRWDSPLFQLRPQIDSVEKSCDPIADAVSYLTKKVDSKSRDVKAQSQAIGGPLAAISIGQDLPSIDISRPIGLPELRRLRRTFIKLTGQTSLSGRLPPSDADNGKRMFVDYLNRELGTI
ncbi:BUD13-like protein [Hibiscus syriacus]|uniref:BUD13-like protein n=1 Tax=Hibiscus syriacus TaxID=106335 RepID=A0A6A2XPB5_HIBSY|nr:BUD13-like protein [Hibiscus syriacus]